MHLLKTPSFVLFKPHRFNGIELPGLPPEVVPVVPYETKVSVPTSGPRVNVLRRQLPLLPGYALTYWRRKVRTLLIR